jgi:hypothetical protein
MRRRTVVALLGAFLILELAGDVAVAADRGEGDRVEVVQMRKQMEREERRKRSAEVGKDSDPGGSSAQCFDRCRPVRERCEEPCGGNRRCLEENQCEEKVRACLRKACMK